MLEFHVFDPDAEYRVVERRLPHWSQAGVISFITFRTADSLPRHVIDRWQAERADWLQQRGINPSLPDWQTRLSALPRDLQAEFHRRFWNRWHDALDNCHGGCVLRDPELSRTVADSLLHFDGERYEMLDFVVMPNHVHLLAVFPDDITLLPQCDSWKHFTAVKINRQLGQSGRFWQQDAFDHLVRSESQFHFLRRYIAENPAKARLSSTEYRHYSKPL
jgi:REP element-mobilizing transposase RayT